MYFAQKSSLLVNECVKTVPSFVLFRTLHPIQLYSVTSTGHFQPMTSSRMLVAKGRTLSTGSAKYVYRTYVSQGMVSPIELMSLKSWCLP